MLPSTVIWSWRVVAKNAIAADSYDTVPGLIALRVDGVAYNGNDNISDDYIANYQELHDSRNWNNE